MQYDIEYLVQWQSKKRGTRACRLEYCSGALDRLMYGFAAYQAGISEQARSPTQQGDLQFDRKALHGGWAKVESTAAESPT